MKKKNDKKDNTGVLWSMLFMTAVIVSCAAYGAYSNLKSNLNSHYFWVKDYDPARTSSLSFKS